jgi:Na+/H+ antiporter NhaD/arsenite permease-like protein
MWTVEHMALPVLISSVILLVVFYALDSHYWRKETERKRIDPRLTAKSALQASSILCGCSASSPRY